MQVRALVKPEDFAAYDGQRVLVLCDIEGTRGELLTAQATPALLSMEIIVERYERLKPGSSRRR